MKGKTKTEAANKKITVLYTVGIFLCLLYFSMINASHGVLLTPMISLYSLTESSQGLTYSAQNFGGTIALLSSLWIMGRMRKPLLAVLALLGMALCLIPAAFQPSYPVLVGLFALVGVGTGFSDSIASSSIADLYPGKKGGRMMGLLHATFGLGGIITPLLIEWMLAGKLSLGVIYLSIALLGIAIAVFVIPVNSLYVVTFRSLPADRQRITFAQIREYFSDRGRVMILLCACFYVGYTSCVSVWMKEYMISELSSDLGAITLSLFWVGMLICRVAAPLLPVRPMRFLSWTMLATTVLLTIGLLAKNALLLCVLCPLTALLSGAAVPMTVQQGCERYRSNTYLSTTIILLGIYLSQMIFPPLVGKLEGIVGLSAAMFLSVLAALLSALAAFWTPVEKASIL